MKKLFLLIAAITHAQVINAGWFSSSTYEECILDSGISDARTEIAAREIRRACRKKHPIDRTHELRHQFKSLYEHGYTDCDVVKYLANNTNQSITEWNEFYGTNCRE